MSPRWRVWSCLHATADDPHAKKSCRHVFSRWRGLSSNMVGETHTGIGYNFQIRPHLLSWVGKNPASQAGATLMCEFCTRPLAGLSIWGVFTPSCTPSWRWRALPTCIRQICFRVLQLVWCWNGCPTRPIDYRPLKYCNFLTLIYRDKKGWLYFLLARKCLKMNNKNLV